MTTDASEHHPSLAPYTMCRRASNNNVSNVIWQESASPSCHPSRRRMYSSDLDSYLIHGSLNSHESASQKAARSVQMKKNSIRRTTIAYAVSQRFALDGTLRPSVRRAAPYRHCTLARNPRDDRWFSVKVKTGDEGLPTDAGVRGGVPED